jgi:hypothetical protein
MARLASLLAVAVAGAPAAAAPTLVALGEDGMLLVFDADRPATVRRVQPDAGARLVAVDMRPADGRLYGVDVANDLHRIDPESGQATLVATLTVPFDGDVRSGADFNPQADRLRLVSGDGQNLRVNVTLGAAAVDRPLAYAGSDPHAGRRPRITAAAYTDNVKDAATTRLFEIDAELDVLVVQEPPNDGVLVTIGPLGVDFGPLGGFDVVSEGGAEVAYAASGSTLYRVDLASGRATALGTIGDGSLHAVSLAAIPTIPAP